MNKLLSLFIKSISLLVTSYSFATPNKSSGWTFRYILNFGPNDPLFNKNRIENDDRENELGPIIRAGAMGFNNHKDRLQFLSKHCKFNLDFSIS